MFSGFSVSKLKPHLKMACSRIQIASNKKAALLKQNLREIALMLTEDPPKEEKAKIRAEALIRDDNLIEAYEILQLECELLFERIKLIENSKDCPPDLVSIVSDLIYASHRLAIPELVEIRKQFRAKYGKKFEEAALENKGGVINERIVHKLAVEPPAAYLVQTYLERICEQFEVSWTPKIKLTPEDLIIPMAAPVGYSVAVAQGTGLGAVVGIPYLPPQQDQQQQQQQQQQMAQNSINGGQGQYGKQNGYNGSEFPMASATVLPNTPPPPQQQQQQPTQRQNNPQSSDFDFEEPDIFIPPAAPSAPPGSSGTSNKKKDDDDDDGGTNSNGHAAGAGGGGPGFSTSSFADLEARFNQLKK